jgi:hypothetical protein
MIDVELISGMFINICYTLCKFMLEVAEVRVPQSMWVIMVNHRRVEINFCN